MTTPHAPTRRGWSLLELLVALALLLGIGALAMPVFTGFGERAALNEAKETVASAVLVCRAEAQRRGVPIELVITRGRLAMRLVVTGEETPAKGEVVAELPAGISVGDLAAGEPLRETPLAAESERLGVFWPNGSVEASAMYVRGPSGAVRGAVSAWTGNVTWTDAVEKTAAPAAEGESE